MKFRHCIFFLFLLLALVAKAQQLTVFSSNVENLLDTESDYTQKIETVSSAMAEYKSDIYCLQEVQPLSTTVNELLNAFLKKTDGNYLAINTIDMSNWYHQSLFIYNADRVKPVGNTYSPYSSNSLYSARLRIQEFQDMENGLSFVLSNNHFKSFNEEKTLENAQYLVEELSSVQGGNVLIVGDLNSELTHDPCQYLVNAGYVEEVESRYPNGYSYYYGGDYEYIDHCFSSKTLHSKVIDATPIYINVKYPAKYGYSDHEPLLVTLNLAATDDDDDGDDTTDETGVLSVTQAYNICLALNNREPTTTEYDVRGTVTEISEVNTSYGNATFVITDGINVMTAYRIKGLNNQAISDEQFLAVGDTVTVHGVLQKYYSTMEICNGYLTEIKPAETDGIRSVQEESPCIYYTLQGVRVTPKKGVYLKRTAEGVRKVMIK